MNPIDFRFNIKTLPNYSSRFDYVSDLQTKSNNIFATSKENLVAPFSKYRDYYDRKAKALLLKVNDYCMILRPLITTEHEKLGKLQSKWTGFYRAEKVLIGSNYLIRKRKTNYTQIVHRVRLKPFIPQFKIEDINDVVEQKFLEVPSIPEALKEPQLFDAHVENTNYRPLDDRSTPHITSKVSLQQRLPQSDPTSTPVALHLAEALTTLGVITPNLQLAPKHRHNF